MDKGTILINKQLQNIPHQPGSYRLIAAKNGKGRRIALPPSVAELLQHHRIRQKLERLAVGPGWEEGDFVFTDEIGHHLSPHTVYHHFKRVARSIGLPDARFHDLRHTAATNMHQLTGDFYTVGQILGHSLKGIGIQLQLSNNLEAVTAQYVDVRMERKLYVLNIYHEAVLGSSETT